MPTYETPQGHEPQLAVSHLGYRPDSPKMVTLSMPKGSSLPPIIPFYIRQNCFRMPRRRTEPEGYSQRFPAPYDLLEGDLNPVKGSFFHQGDLRQIGSRWGTFWQGDFSGFQRPGSYQIEIDLQVSAPFLIADWLYDRLQLGFLNFLQAQRCGCEVPGIHPACHLDDGVLDADGKAWEAFGGWHDAGDFRKWLSFTQANLGALATLIERGHESFRERAVEEMRWGNRLFHKMITEEGQVFEDVAGGSAPPGTDFAYGSHWWFENHPGCYGDATDNRWTDNVVGSGDERMVRTTYNPLVQFGFVEMQMRCARVLRENDGVRCQTLARRAWEYGHRRGHDGRTLFLAQELLAALELNSMAEEIEWSAIRKLTEELLNRQETEGTPITGFFYEQNRTDAFRSIAFSGHPASALLRVLEIIPLELGDLGSRVRTAITQYCDGYLLADSASNPFRLTPYGVYLRQKNSARQNFRDAGGGGRSIRTFIHPINEQGIAHGTSSVLMSHASILSKAANLLGRKEWKDLAEQQIQWTLGHNPLNRSLYTGIGYRQPIAYSFRLPQIPEGSVAGFIGRPDDTPYLEESFAIEWNTLEYWDIPYARAIEAIAWLPPISLRNSSPFI